MATTTNNVIQIKRSSTPGAIPTLAAGELGVNLADHLLYVGNSSGGSVPIGGGSGTNTAVMFNDSGVANSSAAFTFDKTTNTVSIANILTVAIVNATSVRVGANVTVGTSTLFIGNSTVNASISATTVQVANASGSANLQPTQLVIGSSIVNSTTVSVSTSSINSTVTVLGGALTYGGVTLSNTVTGTGGMVLSASPALTGTPTGPTAIAGTSTTQLATTAFVTGAVSASVTSFAGRTGAVVATTGDYTVSQVTGAAALASPTFTGVPAAPTAAGGTNTTQIATTAFVVAALASSAVSSFNGRTGAVVPATGDYTVAQVTGAAALASPALTGTPTAPTAAGGTNTTQLATTAFVVAALAAGNAATATKLATARTIAGTSFDGSTNISITYSNLTGLPTLGTAAAQDSSFFQTALGFTPVQQGTGTGQLSNVVKIGWDGTYIRATIDSTDMGRILVSSKNLADLASASTARTNLGLGTAATTAATAYATATQGGKADTAVQPGGALGTPSSGNLSNCTFPTLNQSTTGTAAKLGQSGNAAIPMTFNWSGQAGQPSWLWGGNDGTNHYVYNPSNFSVSYAASAGTLATARTIAGSSFDGSTNISISYSNLTGLPSLPFSQEYVSSQQTLTFASLITVAHGLGGMPKMTTASLVCITTQAGYSVGDEVQFGQGDEQNTQASGFRGFAVSADATNAYFSCGGALSLPNKSTGVNVALTAASWKVIIRAWR